MILTVLFIFILIEIIFYIYQCKKPSTPQQKIITDNKKHILKTFEILPSLDDYDMKKFIEGFFLGSDYKSLKRGNIVSFLYWALYEGNDGDDIDDILNIIETALDYTFENGYNNETFF